MKKKILILVPSLKLGGQERVAINEAELLKSEYDVSILLFDGSDRAYNTDVPVIDIGVPAKNSIISKALNLTKRINRLNHEIQNTNYDTVLSFGSTANLVNLLSRTQGKRIVSIRSFETCKLSRPEKLLYSKANIITCVSEAMSQYLMKESPLLKRKIRTLTNPYDIEEIIRAGREDVTDYEFKGITIVCHARLEEVKNFPRLIKAISLLRDTMPEIRLLIIGEGSERSKLEKLIQDLNIEDAVTLIGFRSNPFSYIAKSTLYVLPSFSEGFPNSLIEGMAFLPAVSVDCLTGPDEIMNGKYTGDTTSGFKKVKYGYLVEPAKSRIYTTSITDDDRTMADAIKRALTDRDLMKDKRIESVKKFGLQEHKKRIIEMIEGA